MVAKDKLVSIDLQFCVLLFSSETRRLSPVAVLANVPGGNYLDLLNGPQDHGWCDGYTCQQRISTFHAVVADGKYPIKWFRVHSQ